MSELTKKSMDSTKFRAALVAGVSLFAFVPFAAAVAQDADVDTIEEAEEAIDQASEGDTIVVTGSRVKRTEFTSASPVQVIEGQLSRELGVFDTAQLLQESNVATGVQIDTTFTGFVLDNGPGASTLSLRGLDPERTLILINGRRLAPAGAEGAPTSPDLNLIPSALVGRVDVLLDGASSIYGSDAVAGVANIILRDDFDGLELETAFNIPESGGGRTSQVSATWGVTGDNGFIAASAEFFRREQLSVGDRNLGCDEHIEIDENGVRRRDEIDRPAGTTIDSCKLSRPVGRVFDAFGSVWFTPGSTNIDFPNFSEDQDLNGDGLIDVDLKQPQFNLNDPRRAETQNQDLISPLERISFMAFGEYDFNRWGNMQSFFELGYAQRDATITGNGAQIFPAVSPENPTNPCGFEAISNGVFCEQTRLQGFFGPGFTATDAANAGFFDLVPIVRVTGDRNITETTQNQIRIVGGIRGDLPVFDKIGDGGTGFLNISDWTYELFGSYQRSFGQSTRFGIQEDRLALSLNTTRRLPDGSLACGQDLDGDGLPDGFDSFDQNNGFGFISDDVGCVPINLFSQAIMGDQTLTPEEHDFLFGVRTFATELEQNIISGFMTGNIVQLPGGPMAVVLGFEYRQDEIVSRPDDNAEDGNFIGFFSDKGATGRRDLREGYMEADLPLLRDAPFAKVLDLNFSGRWTEESTFGAAWTWTFKGLWKPVDWLTIRGSRGTSFRAPNLREQFFKGSTGFVSGFNDVCVVPQAAQTVDAFGNPARDPGLDLRTQQTLDNCTLAGVDPLTLGLGGVSSIEVLTGGTTDIDEETSRAFTGGVVIDVPFDKFGGKWDEYLNLQISATHFDTEVTNTVEEPGVGFLFGECFVNSVNLNSGFCSRITRNPTTGIVDLVDAGFINIGRVTSRGVDFNVLASSDYFSIANDPLSISLDVRATLQFEQEEEVIDTLDDNVHEIGTPEWRGQATFISDWRNWRMLWRTRYIGAQFNDGRSTFGQNDTCTGLGVDCKNVDFVKDYAVHNASLTWHNDVWSITAGINNVFDRDPPRVDSSEEGLISGAGNFPLGVGYDFFGRTAQFSIRRTF